MASPTRSRSRATASSCISRPVIASAIESLRATKAQAEARKGSYQPRIEARLRAGMGTNFDGVENQKRDMLGQIVLNWNIFNGGIDDARQRQTANLLNQAQDLRDKACRDTRQTTAIAYNDVQKLSEQLGYLERNVAAIEKARDAYRQQFDIGQRSLLDLLNAENEVYTARRAYANAEFDQQLAQARTQAAMGRLETVLERAAHALVVQGRMHELAETTYRAAVAALVAFDRRANLPAIAVPTLLLAAEHDRTAPAFMLRPGMTLLEVARMMGVDIPPLCHDDRLEPYGRDESDLGTFPKTSRLAGP